MVIQDKIKYIEAKRGRNHPLFMFRNWLDEKVPSHRELKLIQVGGTNGKGSTCQWLNLFLRKEGFRTGMFTSPHLVSHLERIQVDGSWIEASEWERIYDRYADFFEEEQLTMFEIDLFMAIVYFVEQKVDYGIIEVGMGGRLDATTALDYIATLITNVGMDHTEYLGTTLSQIAKEKAGIFKESTLAIAYDTTCFSVMEEEAFRKRTSLLVADYDLSNLDTSALPAYQRENLVLALSCLRQLKLLKPYSIQSVIDSFSWLGRCTVLRKDPLVLLDGAHNMPGIEALIRSLSSFEGVIYFSVLKEKESDKMIKRILKWNTNVVLVRFEEERLADLDVLHAHYRIPTIDFEDMIDRLKGAKTSTLICGSLYFVGKVLAHRDEIGS
ncbi:bifunctional folylpolyglutamate synthase/dihydrofolate synthase [Dubosiella newyorkensis]|uniref:bifunctional folylpolyglutamate synthase/dihydrofolate synthase n=1 Tax=Dubosiella newyorkensis TaxID=1862672 RepID=UPI002731C057|nr:Mur ligase family protein [Dubosiella newyorkensis]